MKAIRAVTQALWRLSSLPVEAPYTWAMALAPLTAVERTVRGQRCQLRAVGVSAEAVPLLSGSTSRAACSSRKAFKESAVNGPSRQRSKRSTHSCR